MYGKPGIYYPTMTTFCAAFLYVWVTWFSSMIGRRNIRRAETLHALWEKKKRYRPASQMRQNTVNICTGWIWMCLLSESRRKKHAKQNHIYHQEPSPQHTKHTALCFCQIRLSYNDLRRLQYWHSTHFPLIFFLFCVTKKHSCYMPWQNCFQFSCQ